MNHFYSFLVFIILITLRLTGVITVLIIKLSQLQHYQNKIVSQSYKKTLNSDQSCAGGLTASSRTFNGKIKRVVDSHVKLIELTLNTAQAAVNLFSSIVRVVADVIQSLKPI
jgi:hypothetical protein